MASLPSASVLVDTHGTKSALPVKASRLKIGANNRRWNIRLAERRFRTMTLEELNRTSPFHAGAENTAFAPCVFYGAAAI